MSIVIAILIFGIIIIVHELGHFLAARLFNVRVNEFAIGMGPAIFKRKKGETTVSLRILPIGGFCAMDEDEEAIDERSFRSKNAFQKIVILAAGAIMNLLLGFIVVIITVCMSTAITSTTVAEFYNGAMSEQTGLAVGDKIVEVNGSKIFTDGDISYQFATDEDGVFDMVVERNGEKVILDGVTFLLEADEVTGGRSIVIDFMVEPIEKNIFTVTSYSFNKTIYISRIVIMSFFDILNGTYNLNDISGPVGVVSAIGSVIVPTVSFSQNLRTILTLSAFITINIGIFNLIPLPALDGGRIFFRIIEAIIRKQIKPSVEGVIHFVGLALLMILMVFVTYQDIAKLITG